MRSIVSVALAALALLLAAPAGALAQSDVGLPKGPVPYTVLHPVRTLAKPHVTAAPTAARHAAAAAGASPSTPLPAVAGAKLNPGQALPPAELEAYVDGVVRDAMAREHIAGVTLSIVQNGQVVLKKGYGFSSLEPRRAVDPDKTLFRVGSISKTFTWIALMKEVEAGRIRLNQPVNLYLPERVQVRDQGFDQPVRVINLMDHSAGFEDRALGQLFENDADRVRPLDLYLRQERPKRVRPPGVASSYSNYGAGLAGLAVSYTSGKPFERLIEEEILLPLGMDHTTFREPRPAKRGLPATMPASLAAEVSAPFHWTPDGFAAHSYEYVGQIAPAGAASSTAGDMARYMLMMLNGGQLNGVILYGPKTAAAFRTPLRRTAPGVNGWAHGLIVYDLPGGYRGYGHSGDTIDFHSNLVTVPALNLGIFISTNSESGASLAGRFPDRVVREFFAAPQTYPRLGSPELVAYGSQVSGYYLTNRRAYSGLEGFVTALTGGTTVSVTPQGLLMTTDFAGKQLWAPEGPLAERRFIAADGDKRIAFTLDADRAEAFLPSYGGALNQRAPVWRRPTTLALLAGLTLIAALVTLIGVVLRNRRDLRENQIQSRASLVQNIQAGLWLATLVLFGAWAARAGDVAAIIYRWPGALMIIASACALVAAALTAITLVAMPAIWRGGRRVDGWNALRKAGFTTTVLIYGGFSVVLALWGALSPWTG